jgi:hypothetical protein
MQAAIRSQRSGLIIRVSVACGLAGRDENRPRIWGLDIPKPTFQVLDGGPFGKHYDRQLF